MFHSGIDIIIQRPDSIVDGKQVYTSIPARGRIIDFSRRDVDYFGAMKGGKIILVSSPDIPALPGRVLAASWPRGRPTTWFP